MKFTPVLPSWKQEAIDGMNMVRPTPHALPHTTPNASPRQLIPRYSSDSTQPFGLQANTRSTQTRVNEAFTPYGNRSISPGSFQIHTSSSPPSPTASPCASSAKATHRPRRRSCPCFVPCTGRTFQSRSRYCLNAGTAILYSEGRILTGERRIHRRCLMI